MSDSGDTNNTLHLLIGDASSGSFEAHISGRQGNFGDGGDEGSVAGPGSTHSAVAMSILYSITGLVTLLFLIIIATGAVRAHRNPERYGPRRAVNGRPRQSRAKGLALAVLETIPVVKFRGSDPAKDLEMKLDNIARDDAASQRSGHHGGDDNRSRNSGDNVAPVARGADVDVDAGEGPAEASGASGASDAVTAVPAVPAAASATAPEEEERLQCTICTEDFVIGEDVRVLPCNHKFHPSCVDPWLLNVSGTCPLCRLDLRTTQSNATPGDSAPSSPTTDLPPPLESEHSDTEHPTPSHPHRRRMSQFFRLGSLRQAPPDERMLALRQIITEVRSAPQVESTPEELSRRTRLANNLRDRFRINTRAHTESGS